jgi:hypothetical protein
VGPFNCLALFTASAIAAGAGAIVLMVAKGRIRQTLWNVAYTLGELIRFRPPYLKEIVLERRHLGALSMPHAVAIAAGTMFSILAARIS